MRRGKPPSTVYLAMISDLRSAYEKGNGELPFEKKFSDWAYEFNTDAKKVKRYQLKVRMELARDGIPIVPMFSESKKRRLCFVGLKVCSRDDAGWAEVDGDALRDIKAMRGKAMNVMVRQTARIDSEMLPPPRRSQHKRLIGKQAEQFVRLLEEAVQSNQRKQKS